MSSLHDQSHDDRLIDALANDRGRDDPLVRAWTAECDECRRRVEAWGEVSQLLDETALDERQTLAAIDWRADAPGKELIGDLVRRELAPRRAWWRRPQVAAAAAAVLVGAWALRFLLRSEEPSEQREQMLGGQDDVQRVPSGSGQDFTRFSWNGRHPAGARFELRVWGDTDASRTQVLAELPRLYAPQYTFPPEATQSWPERIRWEVDVYDSFDVFQRRIAGFAQR